MYQQINLHQPVLRRERHLLSARTLLEITLLALFVLFLAGAYLHWQEDRLERTRALLLGQEATLRARLEAEARTTDSERLAQLDQMLAGLHQRLEQAGERLAILEEWASRHRLAVTRLFEALAEQVLDGLWLTEIVVDAETGLQLSGETWDPGLVPEYIDRLVEAGVPGSEGLERVELERPERSDAPVHFLLGPEEHG